VKRRKVIRDDSIHECGLDLGASSFNPFIHFMCQGAEFIVDDGAVGCVYVLHAEHEDGFVTSLVDGVLTLFKASETNFPGFGVRFIRVSDEVLKTVSEEGTQRGDSVREKFERILLFGGHAQEGVWEGVGIVSATDAIVDVNKDLRNRREPKLAVRGGIIKRGVRRREKTMGKDFGDTLEGHVGNGALRGVGEVREKDRVGNGDGVRSYKAFGNSDGEVAEGDRDRRYGNVWNEGFHQRWGRREVGNGESGCGERRQLGEGLGAKEKLYLTFGELNNQQWL